MSILLLKRCSTTRVRTSNSLQPCSRSQWGSDTCDCHEVISDIEELGHVANAVIEPLQAIRLSLRLHGCESGEERALEVPTDESQDNITIGVHLRHNSYAGFCSKRLRCQHTLCAILNCYIMCY